jgi:hypothetical protein
MLVLIGILIFVYHVGIGIYSSLGVEPLPAFEFLYTAAFLCGVVWWLRAEAQRYDVKRVYCPGVLVGMGWVIIVPYFLFKTRGVKGLIPLLALTGTLIAAHVLGVLISLTFSN